MLIKEMQFKPGPELGQILKAIEQHIVLGELANDKEAIFEFIRKESK